MTEIKVVQAVTRSWPSCELGGTADCLPMPWAQSDRLAFQVTQVAILRREDYESLLAEVERLRGWVADLQAGMYVNCVYCGHRYGPDSETPVAMADVLKAHIAVCPQHPMSQLTIENADLRTRLSEAERDQARYFFVRDHVVPLAEMNDAAIDAAILAQKETP